ncbi:peroxiredoxin [sulfur-oxidizing endosymbiont of Gigantopelta aegis]|uniref:peroxiredoxin n=1 Tax=sulfur-oxidizing endosymbiont of Gigantopelta aegis TaxID=2794934 RepID=UPI0018DE19ED|nr:peroxiredoxin [sulfur-oxidizing endosymbiont of Gigantopelta aegis]
MLNTHDVAPSFSTANELNETINLADFIGQKNVVLYFYPKDDTTGCTIEANQFTALADEFAQLDTLIIGVSKDDCASHQAFIKKYALQVMLLADTSGELCNAYGVWQEKEKNGIKKMGIVRSTFIIDKQGNLADVEYGVSADGHAQAVREKIRTL